MSNSGKKKIKTPRPKYGPSSNPITPASSWKSQGQEGTPLDLPSGNTALVRVPGMLVFLEQGFIPNSLMPIIQEAVNRGKAPDPNKMPISPESLAEMAELVDKVAVYCVMEPELRPVPDKDENGRELEARDPNALYVDKVDLDDKTFIFNFAVGGTRDLEPFREGLKASMEPVQPGQDVEVSP